MTEIKIKTLTKKSRTNLICSLIQLVFLILGVSLMLYLTLNVIFPFIKDFNTINNSVKDLEKIWKADNLESMVQNFFDPSASSQNIENELKQIIKKYENLNSNFNNFSLKDLHELSSEIIKLFQVPENANLLSQDGKNFLNLIENTTNSIDSSYYLIKDWANVDLNDVIQEISSSQNNPSNNSIFLKVIHKLSTSKIALFTIISIIAFVINFIFSVILFAFSISFALKNNKMDESQKISPILLWINVFVSVLNMLFFAAFWLISFILWLIIFIKSKKKNKNLTKNDGNKTINLDKNTTTKFNTNLTF